MSNSRMESREQSQYSDHDNKTSKPRQMHGTPVQQLWKISTFHEKRLNNIETQVHKLSFISKQGAGKQTDGQQLEESIKTLTRKINRLEIENASFRKYIQQTNSEKKSVSLEIEEE